MSTACSNSVRLCKSVCSECGYCKGDRAALVGKDRQSSSKAYHILASNMEPSVYLQLLERGWRRSGTAIYKPDNWNSCCPALTIRLPVNEFVPTKSQRRVQAKMEHLLRPPSVTKTVQKPKVPVEQQVVIDSGVLLMLQEWTQQALVELLQGSSDASIGPPPTFKLQSTQKKKKQASSNYDEITAVTTICAALSGRSKGRIDRSTLSRKLAEALQKRVAGNSITVTDAKHNDKKIRTEASSTSPSAVRIDRLEAHAPSGQVLVYLLVQKIVENGDSRMNGQVAQALSKDRLAEWWASVRKDPLPSTRELTITTIPAHESALDPDVHKLYFEYQTAVHQDPDPYTTTTDEADVAWGVRAPPQWMQQVQRMLQHEYGHLSKSRQERIRRAFGTFYEFLVEHPFSTTATFSADGNTTAPPPPGLYHQHYRICGRQLIAVGVVDVLPTGLSSVYLFYDPVFARQLVPLGKYAILREIEWTRTHKLPYYYLGYYIESCPKMVYKADYHPSELLCPTTYRWVDAEQAKETIRRDSPERHCCTLYQGTNEDSPVDDDMAATIARIPMEVGIGTPVTLNMLHAPGQDMVRPLLEEFVQEAGPGVSPQCTVDFC